MFGWLTRLHPNLQFWLDSVILPILASLLSSFAGQDKSEFQLLWSSVSFPHQLTLMSRVDHPRSQIHHSFVISYFQTEVFRIRVDSDPIGSISMDRSALRSTPILLRSIHSQFSWYKTYTQLPYSIRKTLTVRKPNKLIHYQKHWQSLALLFTHHPSPSSSIPFEKLSEWL